MSLHDFVFSEKKSTRYLRHGLFWLACWLFYAATTYTWWFVYVNKIFYPHPGLRQLGFAQWSLLVLTKAFFFLLAQIAACYVFLYAVLPRFLNRRNYFTLILSVLVMAISLAAYGYLIQRLLFPVLDSACHFQNDPETAHALWSGITGGLLNAPKVVAVATIIKLMKRWWLKQKEKDRLEKEKMLSELELLKSQIHPEFLFNSLNNIYAFARDSSPRAPEMLLKLSEMLSYMLYECNDPLVPLFKELKMLKAYMELEKIRYCNRLEMNIQIKGEDHGCRIAPLLLLHFIEHSFTQCNDEHMEQPWINLEIKTEKNTLHMTLVNGKPLPGRGQSTVEAGDDLLRVRRRMELVYPGKHELKIVEDQEIFVLNLELELEQVYSSSTSAERDLIFPVPDTASFRHLNRL